MVVARVSPNFDSEPALETIGEDVIFLAVRHDVLSRQFDTRTRRTVGAHHVYSRLAAHI